MLPVLLWWEPHLATFALCKHHAHWLAQRHRDALVAIALCSHRALLLAAVHNSRCACQLADVYVPELPHEQRRRTLEDCSTHYNDNNSTLTCPVQDNVVKIACAPEIDNCASISARTLHSAFVFEPAA